MIGKWLGAILLPTILLISPAWANDLFLPVASLSLWTGTPADWTIRSRSVDIDLAQLHAIRTAFADASATQALTGAASPLTIDPPPPWATLTLNLFDDVVVTGVVEKMEETTASTPSGTGYWLTGRIVDAEWGSLVLLVRGESVTGTVSLSDGLLYHIRTVGDGVSVISEVEKPPIECGVGDLAEEDMGVKERSALSQAFDETRASDETPEPHSTIDLALFYTPQAREKWGSAGGYQSIEDFLQASVAKSTQAFQESGVHLTLRIVRIQEVNYTEIDMDTDLDHFGHPSDGTMDEIHTIRSRVKADIAVLIRSGWGGKASIGYYDTKRSRDATKNGAAFAVSSPFASTISHEIGHVMGLFHDRYEEKCESPSGCLSGNYPYGYGYVNKNAFLPGASESARWRTIMAYPSLCEAENIYCPTIPRFSNPRQTWEGDPLGVPATSTETGRNGPADAALALNNVRPYVADFYGGEKNTAGRLENPAPNSPQSGVGLVSGWVCDAREVHINFETADGGTFTLPAAVGTVRTDTVSVCGHAQTGFGLLWNWGNLGDGTHTVSAYADGRLLGESEVTVTTLGQAFVRGLSGSYTARNFPREGNATLLEWSEARQNFVITASRSTPSNPGGSRNDGSGGKGVLENPSPGTAHSGVAIISGWHCQAKSVRVELTSNDGRTGSFLAGTGTERTDTASVCGDTNNGYGLLGNWNTLGDGWHEVRVFADDDTEPFATSKVFVTTLGEEFARGLSGEYEIPNFPERGKSVTVEWRQEQQNFVLTGVGD